MLVPNTRDKARLKILRTVLREANLNLHPNVYCVPKSKRSHLIYKIIKKRSDGWYWGKADIQNAFNSVDSTKALRELRRHKLPTSISPILGLNKLNIVNATKPHTGIPQGFSTSPYLFNLYMHPIIRKMNRNSHWQLYIYVDDILFCARTRKQGRECRRVLKRTLERYGYKGRQLKLSTKVHKLSKLSGPNEEFAALGYKFNSRRNEMSQIDDYDDTEKTESESFVAKNAKTFFDDIKTFNTLASEEGNIHLLRTLDMYFPTTFFTLPDWANDDSYMDLYSAHLLSQRLSTSRLKTSRLSVARKREDGIEGSPIFSTFSKEQIKFLSSLNRQFTLNHHKIFRPYFRYLKNPVLNHKCYKPFRDQLWAYYVAFSPCDTLTRFWAEHGRCLVEQFEVSPIVREYILRIYKNELRLINQWEFDKEPIIIPKQDREQSKKTIQQVLTGYATAIMILISQKRFRSIPSPAEFRFGKFQYPTQGFQDATEGQEFGDIYELSQYSEALRLGVIDLKDLSNLVFNCVSRRLFAYRDGELISSLKESGEIQIIVELESSDSEEKRALAKIIEGSSIYEAAKRKQLTGFYKQSNILRSQKVQNKAEVSGEK